MSIIYSTSELAQAIALTRVYDFGPSARRQVFLTPLLPLEVAQWTGYGWENGCAAANVLALEYAREGDEVGVQFKSPDVTESQTWRKIGDGVWEFIRDEWEEWDENGGSIYGDNISGKSFLNEGGWWAKDDEDDGEMLHGEELPMREPVRPPAAHWKL